MNFNTTTLLTDRVPYSCEERKMGEIRAGNGAVPVEGLSAAATAQAFVPAAAAPSPAAAPRLSEYDRAALVEEITAELVPLISERLHAQVSIMIDVTMKQAAAKIRKDFDGALDATVRTSVRKVVEGKLKA